MPFERLDFDDADKFLDHLRLSREHWGDGVHVGWVFRGQEDAEWGLTPSAHRKPGQRSALFDELYAALSTLFFKQSYANQLNALTHDEVRIFDENRPNASEALIVNAVESLGVFEFARIANELGLRLPRDFVPLPRCPFRFWPDEGPNGAPHPVFGLAQHHGCPTRLLDWTRDPLAAAFFAAENIKPGQSGRLTVWAFHSKGLRDGWRAFEVAPATVQYLHAQKGLFTYHQGADLMYAHTGAWSKMDDACETAFLKRLTLPKEQAGHLLCSLYREHVSLAHLKPSLDNVTKTVETLYGHIRTGHYFQGSTTLAPHATESPSDCVEPI